MKKINVVASTAKERMPHVAINQKNGDHIVVWHKELSNSNWIVQFKRFSIDLDSLDGYYPVFFSRGMFPEVAFNDNKEEFLVVWQYELKDCAWDISVRRISAVDGSTASNTFHLDFTKSFKWLPSVASGPNGYLVVWESWVGGSKYAIHCQFVNENGIPRRDEPLEVYYDEKMDRDPVVACNSRNGEFLVVWTHPFSGSDFDIYGRRVSASGTPIGNTIPIAEKIEHEAHPFVIYNHEVNEYLVLWHFQYGGDDWDIQGRRFSSNGVPIGERFNIATSLKAENYPSVAYNHRENEYMVVWAKKDSGSNWNILGRRISRSGSPIGGIISIATTGKEENDPTVVYNSVANKYLVVWHLRYGGSDWDIQAAQLSSDGNLVKTMAVPAK